MEPEKNNQYDEDINNPSRQGYDDKFNSGSSKGSGMARAGQKVKGKAGAVAHQAKKKGIEAAITATGAGAAVAKPATAVLDKLISAKNAKRAAKAGAAIFLMVLLFFGTFINSPQQIFSHTKDTTGDWHDKFIRQSYHLRSASIFAYRYMGARNCDFKKSLSCRIFAGATEREIALMKRGGLINDGDYELVSGTVDSVKRYKVNTFRYIEDGEEKTVSSPSKFIELYPITASLVHKFQNFIIDPKAFALRSPQGIHVLYKAGIIRKNPLGEASKLEHIVTGLRNLTGKRSIGPLKAKGEKEIPINQAIRNGISGTDTDDPEKYGRVLRETSIELDNLVTGCIKENMMHKISIRNRLVKAKQLMLLFGTSMVLIDQERDSRQKNWKQSSAIFNMLNRNGRFEHSKGKPYSDSGAYTLITQGNIRDEDLMPMSRWANGIMIKDLEFGNKGDCADIESPEDFLADNPGGGGVYGGSTASVNTMEWLTPQVLMHGSARMVPDPEIDMEGGYNAGNAFASGASALASYLGRGAGDRPLHKPEFDAIDREARESSQILETAPKPESVEQGSVMHFFGSMLNNISQLFNPPPAQAKIPYKDKYRGDLCTDYDVKVIIKMWPSWACDPIMAQTKEELEGAETNPASILSKMGGGGYVYTNNNPITEEVYYGNLSELLAACEEQGITKPTDCIPPVQVSFEPFTGGPKIFNNNFCDDMSLKSPEDITDWPDPICNKPGPHSYDFVDDGNRLAKYINGPLFLAWYATCIIWDHPIMSANEYFHPKYLPGVGVKIYETVKHCTDTDNPINEEMHRTFQFYVKDRNMADALEGVGSNTLGDDSCSDPIFPNPNKFCALDGGTRVGGSMATGDSSSGGSGAGGGGGGGSGGGAVNDNLSGGNPGPGVTKPATGSDQELAKQILESGNVTGQDKYMSQIKAYANGNFNCHLNSDILRLVATIARSNKVYITSLNRKCTGVLTASGSSSYHYRDGGGHAIDFGIVNGVSSTGGTKQDIALLNSIVGTLPSGSAIGQIQCRPSGSVKLPSGVREFRDTCNHVHIQVPVK